MNEFIAQYAQFLPIAVTIGIVTSTLIHGIPWLQAYLQGHQPKIPSINLSFIIVEMGLLSVFFALALSVTSILPITSHATVAVGAILACIGPGYRFTIVPVLRSIRYDLSAPPPSLCRWLNKHSARDIDVFLYEGPRENALAIGVLPATQTILINASLVDRMKEEHLIAILAHELGHLRHRHLDIALPVNLMCAALIGAGIAFVASLSISPEILKVTAVAGAGGVLGSVFVGLIPGLLMRSFEYAADAFAAEIVGVETMKNALECLDKVVGGAITQGNMTHPPLDQRKGHLETLASNRSRAS